MLKKKLIFLFMMAISVVTFLFLVIPVSRAIDTVPLPENPKLAKRSFTAEFVKLKPNGKIEDKSKVYISPEKMRIEILTPKGKVKTIAIVRRDLNLRWMLNPQNKTYTQHPLRQKEIYKTVKEFKSARNVRTYGKRKYRKYKTTKQKIEASLIDKSRRKKKYTKTVWFSSYYGIPVATQDMSGNRNELRNIKEAKLVRGLFDLPKGYRRVKSTRELKKYKNMKVIRKNTKNRRHVIKTNRRQK